MTSKDIKKEILDKWMPLFFGHEEAAWYENWLCKISDDMCSDCLICLHTNIRGCYGTPYEKCEENMTYENVREWLLFLIGVYKKYKKIEEAKQ